MADSKTAVEIKSKALDSEATTSFHPIAGEVHDYRSNRLSLLRDWIRLESSTDEKEYGAWSNAGRDDQSS